MWEPVFSARQREISNSVGYWNTSIVSVLTADQSSWFMEIKIQTPSGICDYKDMSSLYFISEGVGILQISFQSIPTQLNQRNKEPWQKTM